MCGLQGEICDIDGTCVDAADDEIFKLTTKGGSLSMEREKVIFHSCATASWGPSCTCCLHLGACTSQCLACQSCMPGFVCVGYMCGYCSQLAEYLVACL